MSKMIDKDLKTDEVISLLDQAYDAGMRGYYAFGGEPLLRSDIIEILDYAKEKGYVNVINSNCSSLEKKADLISENTDFIFASLDYPDAYHDVIRGRKGSFNEVMNGINEILNIGKTRVVIVSTISKLNLNRIEEMALLAQKLGMGISYNAVEPTFSSSYNDERTYSPVEEFGLDEIELKHFYKKLLSLKQKGYPLMESEGVLRDYARETPFKCHFPKIFVYVSPDGKIFPCSDYGHSPINLKEISFEEYFSSKEFKEHIKNSETCKICLRTCVRMYSYTYVLRPLHLISLIRTSYKWVTK
jgi:MoaA/NifB/PqqE/SkfB family radical SAM enzyme